MNKTRLKYLFASFACTIVVLLLSMFDTPALLFRSVWGELAVVSLLFTGAVLFLIAGLKGEEETRKP